jgi:hypothetical protein
MRALSYSGLGMYNNCPSSFERRYILKEAGGPRATRESAPAMFRGTDIHNGIEGFLLGTCDLPREAEYYRSFFEGIKDHPNLTPEMAWAFNDEWEACHFDAPEGLMRGVMDATLYDNKERTVHVFEYKTGQKYSEHIDQLNLYCFAALLAFPEADLALGTIMYIDKQHNLEAEAERKLMPSYKWLWERRIKRVMPLEEGKRLYPKRPSWKCKTCTFNAKNGGKCVVPAKGE